MPYKIWCRKWHSEQTEWCAIQGTNKESETMRIVISFDNFLAEKGIERIPFSEDMQRMPRASSAERSRATKEMRRRISQSISGIAAARTEYDILVAQGKIRPPTPTEELELTARGHPDNLATQAAQRVLAKRANRAKGAPSHGGLND